MKMFSSQEKSVGIDISDFSVEAAQLKKESNRIVLDAYTRFRVPQGYIENGIVHDIEQLAAVLQKGLSGSRIQKKNVFATVPESKVFTHIATLPIVLSKDELMDQALGDFLGYVPYREDEIYWDFKEILRDQKERKIFIAGVPKFILDSYLEVLQGAGLNVMSVEPTSSAVARALVSDQLGKKMGYMIIDIGAYSTSIEVFDGLGLRSTYTHPEGGIHLTKLLEKELNLPLKKAEIMKRKIGLHIESEKYGRVAFILQKGLRKMIDEVQKTITFHKNEDDLQVRGVLLTGGAALLPQLPSYLSDNLDVKVGIGIPKVDPGDTGIKKAEMIYYAQAIGLAMKSFRPYHEIDLLRHRDDSSNAGLMSKMKSLLKK